MITIRLYNLKYDVWARIRDAILETIPFALMDSMYSRELEAGSFQFWDSGYVPDILKKFALGIPGNSDLVRQFEARLLEIKELVMRVD